MPDLTQDQLVERLRGEISAVDEEIVAATNRRLKLVAELHAHKRAQGYEVLDPAREERVIQHVIDSNAGPISDAGLRELYQLLLPLCTREAAQL
ncbi:MAG TPA: chorismate mutase [Gaiellales bacterium]|jgi:chorismate mutase|nr:chorismate mutase [Gaiellales bacterium]